MEEYGNIETLTDVMYAYGKVRIASSFSGRIRNDNILLVLVL
jgi:hypothetical protein